MTGRVREFNILGRFFPCSSVPLQTWIVTTLMKGCGVALIKFVCLYFCSHLRLFFNGFGTVNVPLGYPFRVLINLMYLERNLLVVFTDFTYHDFDLLTLVRNYLVPGNRYLGQGTRYQGPGITYQISGTRSLVVVSGTGQQVSGTHYHMQVSGASCQG